MARYETVRGFFEDAERRIDPGRTAGRRASYRFDVDGAGSWRVEIDDGSVSVSERGGEADCVVGASEETFLRIVNGEQSPISAYMLGRVRVRGDTALLTGLRDLLS